MGNQRIKNQSKVKGIGYLLFILTLCLFPSLLMADHNEFKRLPINAINMERTLYAEVSVNRHIDIQKRITVFEVDSSQGYTTKRILTRLEGHNDKVQSISFSVEGDYLVSGDVDGVIILWNTEDWKIEQKLMEHNDVISSLIFCENDRFIASADVSGEIIIWMKNNSDEYVKHQTINNPNSPDTYYSITFSNLRFSESGKFLAAGRRDGTVDIFEYLNEDQEFIFRFNIRDIGESPIYSLIVIEGENTLGLICGNGEGEIKVFDLINQRIELMTSHNGAVWKFVQSEDGNYFASLSSDRTITVWDAIDLREVKGFAFGYYYFQGICQHDLFQERPLNMPAIQNNASQAQIDSVNAYIEDLQAQYDLSLPSSGKENFLEMVDNFKNQYPDLPISIVQYSPTRNTALIRAFEEILGTFLIQVEYAYTTEHWDADSDEATLSDSSFGLVSPFIRFSIVNESMSLYELRNIPFSDEEYFFIEEFNYNGLEAFEEGKDYLIIADEDYTNTGDGHWLAIVGFVNDTKTTQRGELMEFDGFSQLAYPRESREMAKLMAFSNLINLLHCNILSNTLSAEIYLSDPQERQTEISRLFMKDFAFVHHRVRLNGVYSIENHYDRDSRIYQYTIGIHRQDYENVLSNFQLTEQP